MNISILGCGNWGSVFGIMQNKNGHAVKIWEFDKDRAEHVATTRKNEPFLVGYKIPEDIFVHWDLKTVLDNADVVVFAIPSQVLYATIKKMKQVKKLPTYYLSLIKGIDIRSLKRPSEIIRGLQESENKVFVLSGPSIANEIVRGEPTAVVLVGSDPKGTKDLQHQLATDSFRIYQGDDIIGAELGAAIKNVIAIGCGINDGLGFGNNAKGALIARGIVELQRLGLKMGAKAKTFWGLSGLGDLVTTSFSEESRNHKLGRKIGEGKNIEQAISEMVMVAEGVPTCRAINLLAHKFQIEMPICEVVYKIIYENKSPKQAIKDLMTRPLRNE